MRKKVYLTIDNKNGKVYDKIVKVKIIDKNLLDFKNEIRAYQKIGRISNYDIVVIGGIEKWLKLPK